MRSEMAQVKKTHRHRNLTNVLHRCRGRDQAPSDRIEPQVTQILDRAHFGHCMKTILQSSSTHTVGVPTA